MPQKSNYTLSERAWTGSRPDQLGAGIRRCWHQRAYYAMFFAASAILASAGISRSKHSGVHAAFGEHFVKRGLSEPEFAKMLGNAFDSCLDSDYDVLFAAEEGLARGQLADARRFVDRIEQHLRQAGEL